MAFYLLQENGDRITLEDGSGFLLLEETIPGPTINYQGDGLGRREKRKRKRNRTYELFTALENTIRESLYGPAAEAAVEQAAPAALDLTQGYDHALDQLFHAAGEYQDLSARVNRLKREIAAIADRRRADLEADDEETWMLM